MKPKSKTDKFLKDINDILALPVSTKNKKWQLYEYPFDKHLLDISPLYRRSRQMYFELGGRFYPRVCSTMRSLSAQDLFKDEIDYSPTESQLTWFCKNVADVSDPEKEMESVMRFSEISIFHEQNHRIIWRLLPPAPIEDRDLSRYLNFAESLVVMLDLALGDQIGSKYSTIFERLRVIYRSGGRSIWTKQGPNVNRQYLLSLFVATYFLLEMIHTEDIEPALNFIFPEQKKINKAAVVRSLDLSELFTRVTNPQWQERNIKHARKMLTKMHRSSKENALYLPNDPLDFGDDIFIVNRVLDHFGL